MNQEKKEKQEKLVTQEKFSIEGNVGTPEKTGAQKGLEEKQEESGPQDAPKSLEQFDDIKNEYTYGKLEWLYKDGYGRSMISINFMLLVIMPFFFCAAIWNWTGHFPNPFVVYLITDVILMLIIYKGVKNERVIAEHVKDLEKLSDEELRARIRAKLDRMGREAEEEKALKRQEEEQAMKKQEEEQAAKKQEEEQAAKKQEEKQAAKKQEEKKRK